MNKIVSPFFCLSVSVFFLSSMSFSSLLEPPPVTLARERAVNDVGRENGSEGG